MKIIYDLGANNGDDIPYYLQKADLVVALEANPVLCEEIASQFTKELSAGRLRLIRAVLTVDQDLDRASIPFFIHKQFHVLSQIQAPSLETMANFEKVDLPAISLARLFRENGNPYYIKLDLEGYDPIALKEIFNLGIRPPFISAEAHSIDVLYLLAREGGYDRYKLVDGESVCKEFINWPIRSLDNKMVPYCFPSHSAGPFGDDLPRSWLTAAEMFQLLVTANVGWKDIHACSSEATQGIAASKDWLRKLFWVKAAIRDVLIPLNKRLQ